MSATPPLVCPRCRGDLQRAVAFLACDSCAADYPVIAGIPDLRVEPDPWIGLEADRAKALRVHEASQDQGVVEAARTYWALTPTTPREQADRFVDHVARAERRSREWLDRNEGGDPPAPWLDLGTGTADLLAAAGAGGVGVDIAMRWLVVARRRLERSGRSAPLVCANAEHLPFADGSFACVLALGLVEHCRDKPALFAEVRRVLRPGGGFRFRTVNRYGLVPEPHVGVWGVGYLPRRLADRYVRWRTGQAYGHHWPAGPAELKRALRDAGFAEIELGAAPMLDAELANRERARRLVPVYEAVRRTPVMGRALGWVSPLLESQAVR